MAVFWAGILVPGGLGAQELPAANQSISDAQHGNMRTRVLQVGLLPCAALLLNCATAPAHRPPESVPDAAGPDFATVLSAMEAHHGDSGWSVDPRPLVADSMVGTRSRPLFAEAGSRALDHRREVLADLGIPSGDLEVAVACVGMRRDETPNEHVARCEGVPMTFAFTEPIMRNGRSAIVVVLGAGFHRLPWGSMEFSMDREGAWVVSGEGGGIEP